MKCIPPFAVATLLSFSALAQHTNSLESAPRLNDPEALSMTGWDAAVNASFVGSGTTKFQGAHLADSSAYSLNLGVGRQMDLNKEWFVHLGVASDNFFLGTVPGAPVPATIHTLHLNASLGYHLNEKWTLNAFLFPALYRLDEINSDDLGLSGGAMAIYMARTNWIWQFGIVAAPDSDIKVIPALGFRWIINRRSMLEVGFPKTRFYYRLDHGWTLFTGVDTTGTTFRTGEVLGNQIGESQYNHALGTYRDVRVGAGVSYAIARGLHAEAEAGYSVYRRINYTRIDQNVDFDPAPYVRLGLSYHF